MTTGGPVTVRLFGSLDGYCRERGLPTVREYTVPEGGITARDLAVALELPLPEIEGVFVNGHVYGPERMVEPGDRVAFVPRGTPGPHRFFLGLFAAGRSASWE